MNSVDPLSSSPNYYKDTFHFSPYGKSTILKKCKDYAIKFFQDLPSLVQLAAVLTLTAMAVTLTIALSPKILMIALIVSGVALLVLLGATAYKMLRPPSVNKKNLKQSIPQDNQMNIRERIVKQNVDYKHKIINDLINPVQLLIKNSNINTEDVQSFEKLLTLINKLPKKFNYINPTENDNLINKYKSKICSILLNGTFQIDCDYIKSLFPTNEKIERDFPKINNWINRNLSSLSNLKPTRTLNDEKKSVKKNTIYPFITRNLSTFIYNSLFNLPNDFTVDQLQGNCMKKFLNIPYIRYSACIFYPNLP